MELLAVISTVFAVLAIYPLILFIISLLNKPEILVGILPFYELGTNLQLSDFGKKHQTDEFHFNKNIFAKKVKRGNMENNSYFLNPKRTIKCLKNNEYDLPILLYNYGNGDLVDYNLVITFSDVNFNGTDDIKIVEIETEAAAIDSLFVDEAYVGKKGRDLIPDNRIVNYYKRLNLTTPMAVLKGAVECNVFEMFYFKLFIPNQTTQMAINYKIFPLNKWGKTIRFKQIIEIIK
ncbi:MAG: hypothetical protein DWQ05_13660 [Calditrichaeota bacterium]|nr:MAG: hypothetical protein DWQ05_13660 [Calditrichota bacterium]